MSEQPNTPASESSADPRVEAIMAALRTVRDPELPLSIVELGLVYAISIGDDDSASITMTLTTPNCPMADMILQDVRTRAAAVEGVASATVNLVWEPVWTVDRMSEAAKLELEYTGHVPGPGGAVKKGLTSLTIRRNPNRRADHDRR
jgi:metal-sulfur cluster biosynthetic enzyme